MGMRQSGRFSQLVHSQHFTIFPPSGTTGRKYCNQLILSQLTKTAKKSGTWNEPMKPLLGPKDAVSGVTKAGNYVGVLIEVVIHGGNVDVYVRVLLLYALNAFRGAGWAKVDLGKGKELNIVTLHTWPHPFKYNAPDRDASAKASRDPRGKEVNNRSW